MTAVMTQNYRVIVTTQLVRLDDEIEVRDGLISTLTHDASLGGYVQVRELTADDDNVFGEIIANDDEEG